METIMRLSKVMKATGYSRSSIYAKIKAGEFPAPIAIGAHATGWLASEIEAWIEKKKIEGREEWRERRWAGRQD